VDGSAVPDVCALLLSPPTTLAEYLDEAPENAEADESELNRLRPPIFGVRGREPTMLDPLESGMGLDGVCGNGPATLAPRVRDAWLDVLIGREPKELDTGGACSELVGVGDPIDSIDC